MLELSLEEAQYLRALVGAVPSTLGGKRNDSIWSALRDHVARDEDFFQTFDRIFRAPHA